MYIYHWLLLILTIISLIRAYLVDNYIRSKKQQSKRDFYDFINNISVDDFGKALYIIPFLKKTEMLEKQRATINNLTYTIYALFVLYIVSLIFKT